MRTIERTRNHESFIVFPGPRSRGAHLPNARFRFPSRH
jgi:hypothetical protein